MQKCEDPWSNFMFSQVEGKSLSSGNYVTNLTKTIHGWWFGVVTGSKDAPTSLNEQCRQEGIFSGTF